MWISKGLFYSAFLDYYARKMEKALDNKNIAGAVLTNLSKAFDSLDREFAKKQSKNDVHWRELHIFCPRIGYDYLRKLS